MCCPVPLAISRALPFSGANSLTSSVIGPAFFSAAGADKRSSLDCIATLAFGGIFLRKLIFKLEILCNLTVLNHSDFSDKTSLL